MEGTNIYDLENMSKWRTPKNVFISTNATNALKPNGVQIPKAILNDNSHRYGKSSKPEGGNIKGSFAVTNLISNEYNRQYLNDQITK